MGIKIETVQTDTFSMDFFRFGKGERTLVILPGLSVQSVMGLADAVASAYQNMAETFTIYLFDRRKDLPPVYSVRDMARDTAAAFKALGLRDVCLFGASQGGMIAMVLAIEYPELVGKMVRCGSYGDGCRSGAVHYSRRGNEGFQCDGRTAQNQVPGPGDRRVRGSGTGFGRDHGDCGETGFQGGLQALPVHGVRTCGF